MTKREYTIEEVVFAHDILGYMVENNVSLEVAYEDIGVEAEMMLAEEDIINIKDTYFV